MQRERQQHELEPDCFATGLAVACRPAHLVPADRPEKVRWVARLPARRHIHRSRRRRGRSRARPKWRRRRRMSSRDRTATRCAGRGHQRAGCAKCCRGRGAIRARFAGCGASRGRSRRARGRSLRECRSGGRPVRSRRVLRPARAARFALAQLPAVVQGFAASCPQPRSNHLLGVGKCLASLHLKPPQPAALAGHAVKRSTGSNTGAPSTCVTPSHSCTTVRSSAGTRRAPPGTV